jgi:hypothetical protein
VGADGPGAVDEGPVLLALDGLGGGTDHDSLVGLVVILGPGVLVAHLFFDEMVIHIVERH